jgi:Periplasmic copper-binding protein (NosD)
MQDTRPRGKLAGLGLSLRRVVLSLILSFPAAATAGGAIVWVAPPNGTDDTANIQAALDACVAKGPGCTVQLQAGKYLTRQLVEYNFRGTFKGLGRNQTTIEALPNLVVNIPDPVVYGECPPNTTSCLWPSLIIFVDGEIHVSDLSIHIKAPAGTATTGWTVFGLEISSLLDGLRFMGQHPTDVSIDRISIEGLPDNSPNSFGIVVGFGVGFNIVNEIIYTGELPRSSALFDYYFLTGSLTVRNSSFKMGIDGVSTDGFRRNNVVTIGGSPTAGNVFEDVYVGIDNEASESSIFDISYNQSSGLSYSMWVIPWQPVFAPATPSHYVIHDNKFTTTGPSAEGIFLQDNPVKPWIHATIYNNTIGPTQNSLMDGIGAYDTQKATIWNNTFSGTAVDAIGLYGTSFSTVVSNKVDDVTLDPTSGLAQIYLDPTSSFNLVVCASPDDTVIDKGTMNKVIGCEESTGSAQAAPAALPAVTRPNPPRTKTPGDVQGVTK